MTELQCGYEDECENKNCLQCKRHDIKKIVITQAEECCIEDFGWCDIPVFIKEHPEEFELMQKIMRKLFKKLL